MIKYLAVITSCLLFQNVSSFEETELTSIQEALDSPYVFETVNIITGEYCESQTDLSLDGLSVKRHYSSKTGWHFSLPNLYTVENIHPELLKNKPFHYSFDSAHRLITVSTPENEKILNINYEDTGGHLCKIESQNGQFVEYRLNKESSGRGGHPFSIEKVISSSGLECNYEYTKHPLERRKLISKREESDGRFLIAEYYDSPANDVGGTLVLIQDLNRDPRIGSVKQLKAPVGTDNTPIITSRFFYTQGKTEVRDALNNKTVYHYGKNRKISAIENYLGNDLYRIHRYEWDKNDHLISKSVEDHLGRAQSKELFFYDQKGNLTKHTLIGNLTGKSVEEKFSTLYRYDEQNNLVLLRKDNGFNIRMTYEGNLLKSKFTYDGELLCLREFHNHNEIIIDDGCFEDQNDLTGVSERKITRQTPQLIEEFYLDLSSNREILIKRIQNTYSGLQLIQQDLFDGEGVFQFSNFYSYDKAGRLASFTDDKGCRTEITTDLHGNQITLSNNEKSIFNVYDFSNRLIRTEEIYKDGKKTVISNLYDYGGNKRTSTDLYGNVTHYEYDSLGRLVKTILPTLGTPTITYEYDLYDRITTTIDPKGYKTKTTYNTYGKPILIEYPDGTFEKFEYLLDGSLYKVTGKNGSYTINSRDFLGRITKTDFYSKEGEFLKSTSAHYNSFHKIFEKDAMGNTTHYRYDGAGRLIATFQGKKRTEYTYNPSGQIHTSKEWYGDEPHEYSLLIYDKNEIRIEDASGAILKRKTIEPIIQKSNIHYDSEGDCLKKTVVESNGINTTFSYDALGRETSVLKKDLSGSTISLKEIGYDISGNKIKEIHTVYTGSQASTYSINWTYGPLGKVETCTEGDTQTTHTQYNHFGEIKRISKPGGVVISYEYNSLSQLIHMSTSDNTLDYSYTYDLNGNIISIHDAISGTTTSRKFNQYNQMTSETLGNGLASHTVYDLKGRKKQYTLFDGSSIDYHYDAAYIRKVTRNNYEHSYENYSEEGRLISQKLIQSLGEMQFIFDEKKLCREINSPYWSENIQYDTENRISSIETKDFYGSINENFTYGSQNQLLQEKEHSYTYDSVFNRTSKDSSSYTINEQNQLILTESQRYTYDPNGNLIHKNATSYTYDALDRLSTVTYKDSQIIFTYDPFGRRLTKSLFKWKNASWHLDKQLRFLYDGDIEIGAVDQNGSLIELRVLGLGRGADIGAAIAIELKDTLYAPIHDHKGSVRCLVNTSNQKVESVARFSAFGEEKIQGTVVSPWGYSSKRVDEELGLVYFGRRYYDPEIGRWITKDPMGTPDSINRYAFVLNDPLNNLDLYGNFSIGDIWNTLWNGIQSISQTLEILRYNLSFTEYISPHFDKVAQQVIGRYPLHFAGFYTNASEVGVHGKGELHNKVRVTLINGILNARIDYKESIDFLSQTHGGNNIHYVFDATSGWTWDILRAIAAKFGHVSPQAGQLAATWKALIQEMGGIDGGGLVIHYAHSVGGTHTHTALSLLTDEEKKMIRIITFGSPTLSDNPAAESITNYVSIRDGVPLLDPIGFMRAVFGYSENTHLIGSIVGIPFIDHTLNSPTYKNMIESLGHHFLQQYVLY